MSTIMCASKLWRLVRGWDLACPSAVDRTGMLGPWAATRFQEDEFDLVIAISASTYLTLVMPLDGPTALAEAFRAALVAALEDLAVSDRSAATEAAAVSSLSLCRLCEPRLRSALERIEAFCGVELCYHTDLRVVQRNLNELPHGDLEACVPADAVVELLGGAQRRGWAVDIRAPRG